MASSDRTDATRRFYALTDRLQVELRVLEENLAPVHVRATVPSDAGADIGGLVFLLVMETARSAQEDLEAILDTVREINHAKHGQRGDLDFESLFHLTATLYAKQLDAELAEIGDDLDGASELSEGESLRLQMMMDRLSKLMSTLSNVLKKCADTSSQIVQNLK